MTVSVFMSFKCYRRGFSAGEDGSTGGGSGGGGDCANGERHGCELEYR